MGKYQGSTSRDRRPRSGFDKIFGGFVMILSTVFTVLAIIKLANWFIPDETIASSGRRLAEEILFIPVCIVLFFLIFFLTTMLFALLIVQVKKILNIQSNPEYEMKEKVSDKPESPSVWPYWFMVIFFGLVYFFGLFSIVQEMMTQPFSKGYLIIILGMTALLGAPVAIGIFRIRQAGRGENLPTFTQSLYAQQTPYTQQKVSPAFQKAIIGLIFVFFMGLGVLFGEQTLQFQKIAKPATGIVKRWVEHQHGRSAYTALEVQYTTVEGVTKTLESAHHSLISFLMPNVGETVKILYNPYDPTDFRVDQFSEMWSQTIVCVFFSLMVFIFGTIGVLRRQRKHK